MTVGLFIPCYVDQFYPQVARATLELLEKLGCDVQYTLHQTCCGQPTLILYHCVEMSRFLGMTA